MVYNKKYFTSINTFYKYLFVLVCLLLIHAFMNRYSQYIKVKLKT